ncbi:hypothetical protein [Sphingomonas sp. Root241]|uniref:hypothetical protein n=1 Tax=Sphingomonas sp. Root241 TaxID=1736501 RepID=UPI0012E3921F|nr:hypothetical protein [Sphingomonas sp. Root241]
MTGERNHPAQSTAEPLEGWPRDVRPISIDGMDRLGVGDDGSIYWDGKAIEIRRSVTLTVAQKIGAALVTASAVVAAAAAAVSAYADLTSLPK